MKAHLSNYRSTREFLRKEIALQFPPGTRVRRVSDSSDSLMGIVVNPEGKHPREIAGDMVLLLWDNQTQYFVPVDEIEAVE